MKREIIKNSVCRVALLLVMIVMTLTAGAKTVTLTSSTGQVTLNDGDVVTGTGGENTYLVISAGATVTLNGVDITNNTPDYGNEIPSGIACQGDATIILAKGTTNTIIGCYYLDPCIKVGPPNTTLTIKGYGSLYLRSWGWGACIGSRNQQACGNIVIEGGTLDLNTEITASGYAACIGSSGHGGSCGDITIKGGNIRAESSFGAAAIGSGASWISEDSSCTCGNITITGGTIYAFSHSARGGAAIGGGYDGHCGNISISGITSVSALKYSSNSPYCIGPGAGDNSTCGTLTLWGQTSGYIVGPTDYNAEVLAPTDIPYTVSFNANGGTGSMSDQGFYSNTPQALTANGFSLSGKILKCWSTKADGSGYDYYNGETVTNLGNVTLYAQWADIDHAVSFDPNGGTGTMASQDFALNSTQMLNVNTFVCPGYDFAEWNTMQDGSGTSYTDKQAVSNLGNVTLYAQWTPHNYSITYILDGGTNASSNPATYTIEDETFTMAAPIRYGYNFVGWTYEGQSTPVKRITIAHGSTGDKTLVANWTLAPVITLTANVGYWELQNGQTLTGTGGPDTHITIAAGATVTLSDVNLTTIADDNNHHWAGLSCVGDATIILADGTANHVKGGFGTYPAIYVPAGNTLTIRGGGTLNAHGGNNSAGIGSPPIGWWCGNIVLDGGIINAAGGDEAAGIGSAGAAVCGDITITTGVTSVTVSGGIRSASIGAGLFGSCGTVTIGGVVTGSIYGSITYRPADNPACTITFDANDGTGDMDAQQVLKKISIGLNDCAFTREDYVFTGWNTEADGSGTHYANGQAIAATGNMTLYAQWDHRDDYHVTFDANGGTGSMEVQTFIKHDPPQNLSTCTFTREGYAFVGWNTKADGSGTAYTDEQSITVTGDMTLYAQWRELLAVTFHANGGTGTMDSQTFVEGVPQSLNSCTFTVPAGGAFAGWNTETDGSGIAYAAGVDVTLTGDITLYAQWREGSIVTFDANGGTGTMTDQTFGWGISQYLNACTFTRSGYFFVAWNTAADGSGTTYADKASITISADMMLYAQWSVRSDRTISVYDEITATLYNGDMLTGTGETDKNVTITDGATVIFSNVSLTQIGCNPCIICNGDATIILSGNNYLEGGYESAGIYIPEGKTLTIRGTGSLTAKGKEMRPGIGGQGHNYSTSCGNIIISSEVAFVTAETSECNYCIGPAADGFYEYQYGSCGTVIIGGVETGPIAQQSFTYRSACTVAFDANGGTGTMAEQTFRSGTPQNLNACTMIREGYLFVGWNTAANGTGTSYTDEQAITATSDMTLYAQWRRILSVTFDPNGSAGTMESQLFYEGIAQNLSACTFTAPLGCHFIGWNTSRDGSGTSYTDEQAVTLTDNTTLYAQWVIPVWVNNNRLTWANRYDILGDGTMSFDPLTNTLTLDHPTQNVPIRTEGIDLTVKGFYQMTDEAGDVALDVVGGTLTLEGDFTLRGAVTGVQAGGDMNVKGQLRTYGTSGSGIHYTGTGNAWLTLQPGFIGTTRVEMQGATDALSYTEGNVFRITTNGFVLSEPANGQVVSSEDMFKILEGGVRTKRAVFTIAGTANGEGTAASPYQILSSDDWTRACADVDNGCETAGIYLELNTSITATTMMGRPDNPFAGVIDGQRNYWKVTSAINKDVEGAALFRSVSGATIKNFCVEGSVIGGAASGGIVGQAVDGTTTVENCVFNGTVITTTGEPAANFVCGNVASEATVTYNNCLDATNLLWPAATDTRAYSVTGVDATLTLTGTTGIAWNNAIYAPQGATVEFTMITVSGGEYVATGGTLSESGGTYSLVMPAQNVTILPKNSLTYAVTGNISTGGEVEINKTEAAAGMSVYVTITPDSYYMLSELTVKDANDNEIPMTMYEPGFGFFTMPSGPVTVTVSFNKKYSFDATTGELRLLCGEFNSLGTNGFGPDVTGDKGAVLKVTAAEGVRFTGTCASLFEGFTNCSEIDLMGVNTSAMTRTTSMFEGCTSLSKLNMTGWNLEQVEYMSSMFENCSSLREIDLSGINLNTNATMTEMFSCSGDNTGVCKLTLPAGMGVTASMRLNKGYYYGVYNGEILSSGWQLLGDKTVVSGTDQYKGWTCATLPAQLTTATFVWSKMPEDFVLELPDDQDNSAVVEAWDGVTTNVRLTGRKLWKDGDWNTICLPFKFTSQTDYNNIFSAYNYMVLDTEGKYNAEGDLYYHGDDQIESDFTQQTGFDADTGTLTLYFDYPPSYSPNTPYIIRWEKDTDNPYIESPEFTNVIITKTMNNVTSQDGKVSFVGNYDYRYFTAADKSILFLGTDNTLYYPEPGGRIGPFRAYFQVNLGSQEVKQFVLNFGDVTDRIESLSPNPSPVREGSADAWYDLNGRKLSGKPAQRGIYIYKGKKVVIK